MNRTRGLASLLAAVIMLLSAVPVFSCADNSDTTVYVTRTGECYHTDSCRYLKSKIETTLGEADENGYRACSVCDPPVLDSSTRSSTCTADNSNKSEATVYITRTGECYHKGTCSCLSKSKIETTLGEATDNGYRACSKCHPPKA